MTDYFALFNEPRRPCLDADALKKKFHSLSVELHPDKIHSAGSAEKDGAARRYAELNSAFNCLRETPSRLRHLIELESGRKAVDLLQMPDDLADLFMEVGALCRQVDAFLKEKAAVSSPLLLAQLFERGQSWVDQLQAVQRRINDRQAALRIRLQELDSEWMTEPTGGASLLPRLEEVWRLMSFYGRWSGQLQERVAQLAM
ncbi:MAG TPA: hypothetical protein PKA41_18665 [Verrucomicrobiota bacterium]|nr:hypothetical protein [Verrucomicrobiota bacterium]